MVNLPYNSKSPPEFWETFGLNEQYWIASKNALIESKDTLARILSQQTVYAFSDTSGTHPESKVETDSIAFIGESDYVRWLILCKELRLRYKLRNRTISYKSMNDAVRRRAMTELLEVIRAIPIFFVAFHKERGVRPLHGPGYPDVGDDDFLAEMKSEWKVAVADKAAQISHVLCFAYQFIARPHQRLIWVSDQDSFCHTETQIKLLQKLCINISPGYAHFTLGPLSIFTTRDDTDLSREDGVALADLTAGATNELINAYAASGTLDFPNLYTLPARNISWKARKVMTQLFVSQQPCALLSLLLYKGSVPDARRSNVLRLPSPVAKANRGIIVPPFDH
jgi:hypothetical protein